MITLYVYIVWRYCICPQTIFIISIFLTKLLNKGDYINLNWNIQLALLIINKQFLIIFLASVSKKYMSMSYFLKSTIVLK